MSAIHYLAELNGSKKRILDDAPEQIISGPWKRLVYDRDGRILRAGYSLSQQSTVAAQSLQSQAESLLESVSVFKLAPTV